MKCLLQTKHPFFAYLITLFLLQLAISPSVKAESVDQEKALLVAQNYTLAKSSTLQNRSQVQIHSERSFMDGSVAIAHLFELDNKGFILVAGDDRLNPILGYSFEGNTDLSETHAGIEIYIEGTRRKIAHLRSTETLSSKATQKKWAQLSSEDFQKSDYLSTRDIAVAPLMTTGWNQDQYYNAACPAIETGPAGHAYVGCVPVAVGQLINYWQYPAKGNGFVDYVDPQFGEVQIDLAEETFNYSAMEDTLHGPNDDVAHLLYITGAALNTAYSDFYTATFLSIIDSILIHKFKYDCNADWVYRVHTNDTWYFDKVESELDEGRPVLMRAVTGDTGHQWVCDGYDTDGLYHMNWGWGGSYNGWFADNGSYWEGQIEGSDVYYYDEQALIYGIQPAYGCQAPKSSYIRHDDPHETYTYVYIDQPAGPVMNQFRYRVAGSNDAWVSTNPSDVYFQFLGNLTGSTEYEYQARVLCSKEDWSDWSEALSFTTTGDTPNTPNCTAPAGNTLSTSSIGFTSAYVYIPQPTGAVDNQFRYRIQGSSTWTETTVSNNYYTYLNALTQGSTYEVQARVLCSNGLWSLYASSLTFTTQGEVISDCNAPGASQLTTSSTSDFATYVYLQGATSGVENQFRYKPVASGEWSYTDQATNYYRYLTGLLAGTEYEFQARVACTTGYSEYSSSATFTTTGDGGGGGGGDCATTTGNSLYTSSIGDNASYIYTPTPAGTTANQFRYRATSGGDWTETNEGSNYYRYITGLSSGTEYEFQVRFRCSAGLGDYSDSQTFTTTGEGGTNPPTDCEAPSVDDLSAQVLGATSAYMYYFNSPAGAINQFRYRAFNSTQWIESDQSSNYYRYINTLQAETLYQLQVRYQCASGWTDYSDSTLFETE